ncbi:MAG: hypothetical protein F6K31_27780 [Symploca sp. SIO2G7]|nr:hypothetical protein [Symploca sp. SIO2G7]
MENFVCTVEMLVISLTSSRSQGYGMFVLNQFSILNSQFSILNSQFSLPLVQPK